ncbi:MAG: site-2 protease family protein [Desulfurococcales archaeon]|nr:site-2 protease family protein [Desulfurococcales archaeon]
MEAKLAECRSIIESRFQVIDAKIYNWGMEVLIGEPRIPDPIDGLTSLYHLLISRGCKPLARPSDRGFIIRLFYGFKEGKNRYLRGLILAAITFVTVYYSGVFLSGAEHRPATFTWSPLGYLTALLVPLLIHEMGHWIMMRRYRVPASIPYLIPAPPLQLGFLGTFGAVINLRWLPPTADSLAIIAVAGPLAGFIAAIPFTLVGLQGSLVQPVSEVSPEAVGLNIVPLTLLLMTSILDVGEGYVITLSPMAFASYVVFLVTFLNLMPIAMLDGGHIVRSAVGESMHNFISKASIAILLGLSFIYPGFSLFALLAIGIYIMTRGRHPGPAMGIEDLSWKGIIAVIVYGILLVLNAPIPVG